MMDRLWNRDKSDRVRFRMMTESGLLVDEQAEVVQTQVIAHKARAAIRNREAVPLYHQTEEGRPPTWRENLIVETGLSQPPGHDSRFILDDSHHLFTGIKYGSVELEAESRFKKHLVAIGMNVAAVLIFFGCLWLVGKNIGLGASAPTAAQETPAQQEAYGHGFVDQVEGPEREEGRTEEGSGGPTPGSGGAQDGS